MPSVTLWLRFLFWPALVVGLLGVVELGEPSSGGLLGFLTKMSAALVGYGVGSVVPYILSDEFLRTRFATVDKKDGQRTVEVSNVEKKIDTTKTNVLTLFAVGLVCWFANQYLPWRPMFLQYPLMTRWFWLTGPLYCLLAGALYVYIRQGPELKTGLTSDVPPALTETQLGVTTETKSVVLSETELDSGKEQDSNAAF